MKFMLRLGTAAAWALASILKPEPSAADVATLVLSGRCRYLLTEKFLRQSPVAREALRPVNGWSAAYLRLSLLLSEDSTFLKTAHARLIQELQAIDKPYVSLTLSTLEDQAILSAESNLPEKVPFFVGPASSALRLIPAALREIEPLPFGTVLLIDVARVPLALHDLSPDVLNFWSALPPARDPSQDGMIDHLPLTVLITRASNLDIGNHLARRLAEKIPFFPMFLIAEY